MRFHFFALILAAWTLGAYARPCESPLGTDNEEVVSLVGRLHKESHWGPPGFGEDPKADSKFTAWVLVLDKPIQFHLGNESSQPRDVNIDKIQIQPVADLPPPTLKKLLGKV